MKRQRSNEDSMIAMVSICHDSSDGNNSQGSNPMKDFETMLEGMEDEEGCRVGETCQVSDKKRRLRVDQVRALERSFEVDNKLDPERKLKLAREVGLEPRQVAVWFQNRRARWKAKQLEKDYVSLKADYDGLRLGCEKLQRDNESLLQQIRELKSKLNKSYSEREELLSNTEEETRAETPNNYRNDKCEEHVDELNCDKFSESILNMKDGSSDSNSSAILNEDNNNNNNNTLSNGISCKNTHMHYLGHVSGDFHPQQWPFVKVEEHDLFDEESCSSLIFSDDQAPMLHWYLE